MARKASKRRSDGQFEYKGTLGKDIHGKAIRKSFYSNKSKTDAKRKFEAYKEQQAVARKLGISLPSTSQIFRAWAETWLEVYKRPNVDETSYTTTYLPEVNRLISYFGHASLDAIRPLDVQQYFNLHRQMSMSRLKKQKFILNAIFESAIDNELCARNPAKAVVLNSKHKPKKRRALSDDEMQQFILLAAGKRDDAVFMLLTGIRRGEMLGLIWDDYHASKKELKIQRSIAEKSTGLTANPPKWESYRTLPLSDDACAVLERQPRRSRYIFPDRFGNVRNPRTWSQMYRKFVKTLPENLRVTPHELRHSYGSQLWRHGVDIYTIKTLLGHKSIDITTEIYVHSETDSLRDAIKRAEK